MSSAERHEEAGELVPFSAGENFTLYLGDVFKTLDQLPSNSVDLIFADPPYNLSNDGFTVHAGKRVKVNKGEWDRSNGVEQDFDFHIAYLMNR